MMQEHSIIIDSRTILDEPMPLVRSGKYSLIPDVIHGWKPQKRASQDRKLSRADQVVAKSKKQSPFSKKSQDPELPETTYAAELTKKAAHDSIGTEMSDPFTSQQAIQISLNTTKAEICVPEQRPPTKFTNTEEKYQAPQLQFENNPAAEQQNFGNIICEHRQEPELAEPSAAIPEAQSATKTIEIESHRQEPSHQDQQEHALIQSLAAQEPEPDPDSQSILKEEMQMDLQSEKIQSEMMLADAEALPFMEENFSIFNSQKELQKPVKQISIDTKSEAKFTMQTPKIPLIENTLLQQQSEAFLNAGAHELDKDALSGQKVNLALL